MNNKDLHLAIIMDGNGRWAQKQGWPRSFGHSEGAKTARKTVEYAARCGVGCLTLFVFSCDNWSRPADEVRQILRLLTKHLLREIDTCLSNGIRLSVIGRRDRLPKPLVQAIETAERRTRTQTAMHLRLAVDFSSRDAIARAAQQSTTTNSFQRLLSKEVHSVCDIPSVDILVRTGGERRLSDFLLWECAYAELFFLDKFWPEFASTDLDNVLEDFLSRERRYGGLPKVLQQDLKAGSA